MKTTFSFILALIFSGTILLSAAEPSVPAFRAVEIDGEVGIGYGLAIADVDGDGKPDVVLVDKDLVAWYRNPEWSKPDIARDLTDRAHVCTAARDLDGDGKAEIVVGGQWNPGDTENSGSVHYLMPPEDRTQLWRPVELPKEPTVHRMRWVRSGPDGYELVVVPLHGRGNRGGQGAGVRILAYERPADPTQTWSTRLIDDSLHVTHNLDPVSWADESSEDLLVAGREGIFLFNREGDGWRKTQLGGNDIEGAGEVRLGRLPGGARFIAAIEPLHGSTVAVYTPPDEGEGMWTRRVIDESLVDGHALAAGDLAGSGSDQLVVGWRAMNRPANVKVGVKLFTPLDAEGRQWKETLIDDNGMACEDLQLADLNGDGRLDIVAAGRATGNLKIYWNDGVK
jgi:hypothetical protein